MFEPCMASSLSKHATNIDVLSALPPRWCAATVLLLPCGAFTGVAATCSACSSDPLAVPQRTNIRFADRKSGCKLLTQPREVEWAGKREEVTSDGAGAAFIGTIIRPVQFCLQKARFRAAPPGTSWAQQAGGRSPCPRSGLPPPLSRRVWRTEGQSGQRASGAACGGAALWRQAGLSSAVVSTPTPL